MLWSVVEKTALAEAEVEYGDHRSTTVYVRFKVLPTSPRPNLHNASVVIWTTTPWTLPGNRAIAVSPQPTYVHLKVTGTADDSLAVAGEEIIIAKALIERVVSETGITAHDIIEEFPGAELVGVMCQHPLRGSGYDFDVTVWPGDFVDMEQGTGFVHIAPGHGADDFVLGAAHGIEVPETVDGDGRYVDFRAAVCRSARLQGGRRDRRRDRGTGRPARQGQACAQLSPFVAVQGAAHLPHDAAVVHQHDRERPPQQSAPRHRRGALDSADRPQPYSRHDRKSPRVGDLAPARLGRADHGLRQQRDR